MRSRRRSTGLSGPAVGSRARRRAGVGRGQCRGTRTRRRAESASSYPARGGRVVLTWADDGVRGYGVRMPIYGYRRRVACYVTRVGEAGSELLVFDHVDDDPDNPPGTQIPAGGMLPFEGIEAAAAREAAEETGLSGL